MQVTCHLSRRWHQQFCHSPSFGSHQQCLQFLIPKRSYRTNRGNIIRQQPQKIGYDDKDLSNDLTDIQPFAPEKEFAARFENRGIQEYEQFRSNISTRKRIDPSKPLRDQAEKIWKELQEVEAELQEARKGPFNADSPLLQQLPVDEREELLKLLYTEVTAGNEEEDSLDLAELDRLIEQEDPPDGTEDDLKVTIHIPKAQQAFVTRFNKALSEAQEHVNDPDRALKLWKWYLRCQQRVPGLSSIIPERVWTFLWQSQRLLGSRPRHVIMLGRDMMAADLHLDTEQRLEMIRALHASNDTASALKMWEDTHSIDQDISPNEQTSYAQLGVELYAAVGRPEKAQRVALNAVTNGASPEILVTAIQGWAQSKDSRASVKIWVLYLKLRDLLGDSMEPQLYEKISDNLLGQNSSQMALTVFKDMIARIQGDGMNTLSAYRDAMGAIPLNADSEHVEEAINQTSLNILLALPQKYRNKFFFASWIKKLIGQGHVESAAMVVDLMYERKIKPDAMHLNGLIGAWLRENRAESRQKALLLSQEMIQTRILQAEHQTISSTFVPAKGLLRKYLSTSAGPGQKEIQSSRPVPAANHETFLLLFNHYSELGQWESFEQLSRTMTDFARLTPNVLTMNKLLSMDLKAGNLERFWSAFHDNKRQSRCNIETFRMAWQAVSNQRAILGNQRLEKSLHARELFGEMVNWFEKLSSARKSTAIAEMDDTAYSTIIRSFAKQADLTGLLCAVQGLDANFNAGPDDTSLQLMLTLAAQRLPKAAGFQNRISRRSRRLRDDQTLLKDITELVHNIEMKHKFHLVNNGTATEEEVDNPNSKIANQIRVDVITEVVLIVTNKTEKPGSNTIKSVRDVAKIMEVEIDHLDMEEILGH